MQLTKLEHSGIILDKNGQKLVFDPVEYTATLPELHNVVAIIITHMHADHLQPERIADILALNPEAQVIAPADAAAQLPNATTVQGGETMRIDEFDLQFFSKDHAAIFAGQVPCQNLGVVVDGRLTNPGDSFDLLEVSGVVETLLVPEAAPWAKISETIEFINLAKPKLVIPVHNAVLSEMGREIYDRLLANACARIGAEFAALDIGESLDV